MIKECVFNRDIYLLMKKKTKEDKIITKTLFFGAN